MAKASGKSDAKSWQPMPKKAVSQSSFVTRPFPAMQQPQNAAIDLAEVKEPQPTAMMDNINRSLAMVSPPAPPTPGLNGVQAKLTIGAPGDKYEQEADRVARQVVTELYAPPPPTAPAGEETSVRQPPGRVQRQISIRASGSEGGDVSSEWEGELNRARSGGQPLPPTLKEPMERSFGADFGGVRVHTGEQADRLARPIQAKAFTTGQNVFFRQGAYQPGSRGGKELIAHELTHVVQQSPLRQGKEEETSLRKEIISGDNSTSKEIQRYLKIEGKEKKESDVDTLVNDVIQWASKQGEEWKSKAETNEKNINNVLNTWLASKAKSLPFDIKLGSTKNGSEAHWKDFPSFSQFAMHLIEESNPFLLKAKKAEVNQAREILWSDKVAKEINELRLKVAAMLKEKMNPSLRRLSLIAGHIKPNIQGSYNWAGSYPKNLPALNLINSQKDYTIFQNIAVMHDVMELLSSRNAGRVVPTILRDIVPEPFTSVESKSTLYNKTKQIEYKATERKEKGYDRGKLNIGTRDETSLDTQTARMLVLPIAAGRSHTTARMMELAELAQATIEQKTSLALGLFAYWNSGMRGSYPVGLTPVHTYHEVMDVAKSYGVPYEPIEYSKKLQSPTAKL